MIYHLGEGLWYFFYERVYDISFGEDLWYFFWRGFMIFLFKRGFDISLGARVYDHIF